MITDKNILNLATRKKIFDFIEKNPGLHMRELSRRLDIPKTTLNYHLNYLKKQDLISSKPEKAYNRYWIKNGTGSEEKKILKLLRDDVPRKILVLIMSNIARCQKELCEELQLTPSTVHFHLQKLIDMDFITIAPVKNQQFDGNEPNSKIMVKKYRNEKIYMVKDPDTIHKLILKYYTSFAEDAQYLKDYEWFSIYMWKKDPPKKLRHVDDVFDVLTEMVQETFKPPFCA